MVTETPPVFVSAYRVFQGLSTQIFYIFLSPDIGYGRTDLMKHPNNFLRCFLDFEAVTPLLSTFSEFILLIRLRTWLWANFEPIGMKIDEVLRFWHWFQNCAFFAHSEILVNFSGNSKIKKWYIFWLSFLCWSRIKCQKLEKMFRNHQFAK